MFKPCPLGGFMNFFSPLIILISCATIAGLCLPVQACAQDATAKPFTYTDAVEMIRAKGYEGPLREHPAIIAHVKQEAGPKLEPLITQLRETIKVEVDLEYGAGDQTTTFKPYRAKNFVMHAMSVGPDFPMMDGFITMGETLDILEIPDFRNAVVKIAVARDENGDIPDLNIRVGRTDTAVKLLVSKDIYTAETYYIEGLSFDELISVELGNKTLNAKSLYTF